MDEEKLKEVLKNMVLEAAEYHPSDLEDEGDEWAEEFVDSYISDILKTKKQD